MSYLLLSSLSTYTHLLEYFQNIFFPSHEPFLLILFFCQKKNQTTNGQMLPLLTTFHRVRLYISDQDTNHRTKIELKVSICSVFPRFLRL